jgi:hypothetical protein
LCPFKNFYLERLECATTSVRDDLAAPSQAVPSSGLGPRTFSEWLGAPQGAYLEACAGEEEEDPNTKRKLPLTFSELLGAPRIVKHVPGRRRRRKTNTTNEKKFNKYMSF